MKIFVLRALLKVLMGLKERPNINLEVVIGEAQQRTCGVGPSDVLTPSCNFTAHASNFISTHLAQALNSTDGSGSS